MTAHDDLVNKIDLEDMINRSMWVTAVPSTYEEWWRTRIGQGTEEVTENVEHTVIVDRGHVI